MAQAHNKGKGRGIAFLRALIGHSGDACITWPLSRQRGYAIVGLNGKIFKAHRLMCELAHGAPPSPDYEAAHSCGRGHHGCVNPNHLSWKTRAENQQDRRRHNTHGILSPTRFKLTEANIAEIRAKEGIETVTDLAARFGVTRSTIRQIHLRKTWVTGKRAKGGFAPGDPRNPFARRASI
jgi:DNA-binding transcriptional regulator YiaG